MKILLHRRGEEASQTEDTPERRFQIKSHQASWKSSMGQLGQSSMDETSSDKVVRWQSCLGETVSY